MPVDIVPMEDGHAYDPHRHHRRSTRLPGYDYGQPGAYFVTIVAQDRARLSGEVLDGEMRLNDEGRMVGRQWRSLPEWFRMVELDTYIVMPNHFHAILIIQGAPEVGYIVGAFKFITTVEYIHGVNELGWPPFRGRLWQRNYYEHIIRDKTNDNASANIS
ncbi:MAG: transposase [Chloroflexota bacterium]